MLIKVCTWSACKSKFSNYMVTRIKRDIEKSSLKNVKMEESPCMWECRKSPNARIDNEVMNYANPCKLSEAMFKKLKK
jgi:NADH:ubiquinone oxidoreductase subunit E